MMIICVGSVRRKPLRSLFAAYLPIFTLSSARDDRRDAPPPSGMFPLPPSNGEGETLRVGTSDRHPKRDQALYTQRRPFLHTLHDRLKAGARFEDQSKNGATGPEIRVRWGEYHAGNAGESRLAVRCLLDDPLPTCAKTRNHQLHHQGGLISRT